MTIPTIPDDIAGWWVRMHEDPWMHHAVADPCPIEDPQCKLNRKSVEQQQRRLRAEEEDRL